MDLDERAVMADTREIDTVEEGEDCCHVRFRDPDRFAEIRTPDCAANAAQSVSAGSEVRTGREDGEGDE